MTDTRIGKSVAGYRLESLLGRGGMSVVYLAEHARLGRKVALKVLAAPLSGDESFRERFERESRRAAEIDHPNVIPIYDAGDADGELYIAMRYVEGSDLKTLLAREGGLNVGRAMFILEQAAAALDAAHERNLVHRDVKPANILIEDGSDRVYVTDFGVVKHTATRGSTQTGFFIGTADYAAPEQIEGLDVDRRADVYALGCVVYEMLTGRPPYDREAEVAVMHAHLTEPAPKVTEARPEMTPAIDAVVERAMAKQREARYATCTGLADAARAAVLQQPVQRGETGAHAVLPAAVTGGTATGATVAATQHGSPAGESGAAGDAGTGLGARIRSTPTWAIALLSGALAAIVAVAIVLALSGSDSTQPEAAAPAEPSSAEVQPPSPAEEPSDGTQESGAAAEPAAGSEGDGTAADASGSASESAAGTGDTSGGAGDGSGSGDGSGGGSGGGDGSGEGDGTGEGATSDAGEAPTEAPTEPSEAPGSTAGAGDGTGALDRDTAPVDTLAAIVPAQLLRECTIPDAPGGAAIATASCDSEDDGIRFAPDGLEISVFATGRELDDAYQAALGAVPANGRPTEGEGRCNGSRWGGEGDWLHGQDRPGGQRFCAFVGDDALIVWTHRKFGQEDHVNTLGIAREGGANHARLFDWWRFWVHRIGLAS